MKKESAQINIKGNIKALGITLFATVVLVVLFGYMWKAAQNISIAVAPRLDVDAQKDMDNFAQCLASEKMTMYGASWCAHCKKEKSAFGSSFAYVPYVECPDNIQTCLDKGIAGYPTWITAEGVVYEGEQGLEKLAEITGCSLSSQQSSSESSTTVSNTIGS